MPQPQYSNDRTYDNNTSNRTNYPHNGRLPQQYAHNGSTPFHRPSGYQNYNMHSYGAQRFPSGAMNNGFVPYNSSSSQRQLANTWSRGGFNRPQWRGYGHPQGREGYMRGGNQSRRNDESSQEDQNLSRTNLYIRGLQPETTDEDLRNLCSKFGKILSTKAIKDNETQSCKGYGFVDFEDSKEAEAAMHALQEKGIQAQMAKQQERVEQTNVYVANLPVHLSESDLQVMFEPFGTVVSTKILNHHGISKGVGFVKMETKEACEKIINVFNGKLLPRGSMTQPLIVKFASGANKKKNQNSDCEWNESENEFYEDSDSYPVSADAAGCDDYDPELLNIHESSSFSNMLNIHEPSMTLPQLSSLGTLPDGFDMSVLLGSLWGAVQDPTSETSSLFPNQSYLVQAPRSSELGPIVAPSREPPVAAGPGSLLDSISYPDLSWPAHSELQQIYRDLPNQQDHSKVVGFKPPVDNQQHLNWPMPIPANVAPISSTALPLAGNYTVEPPAAANVLYNVPSATQQQSSCTVMPPSVQSAAIVQPSNSNSSDLAPAVARLFASHRN